MLLRLCVFCLFNNFLLTTKSVAWFTGVNGLQGKNAVTQLPLSQRLCPQWRVIVPNVCVWPVRSHPMALGAALYIKEGGHRCLCWTRKRTLCEADFDILGQEGSAGLTLFPRLHSPGFPGTALPRCPHAHLPGKPQPGVLELTPVWTNLCITLKDNRILQLWSSRFATY